ncbi:MAG: cell surface protein SprA [Bacteroidaceae bacterium]|nr:cell surface protein SprA [Bacteroidaceae bacterium]
MKQRVLLILLLFCTAIEFIVAQNSNAQATRNQRIQQRTEKRKAEQARKDSLKPIYPISQTTPLKIEDIKQLPMDLRTPANIKPDTTYHDKEGTYSLGSRLGESGRYLSTPILLTQDEYVNWRMSNSMQDYFRKKNDEEWIKAKEGDKFDFTDMHFDLGPAEKIFGPGGVKIKTQGNAEIKFGYSIQEVDNPSLSERNRKTNTFDFDEKINLNVKGSVGDKMNMDFNYNTEATFSYDAKKINLKYDGKEDEVIKLLEAGNVTFPTNSSLIKGASSLFGIRADLQFGKLTLQTVLSQKTSNSTVVNSKGGTQLTTYEIEITDYDENKHFFLAHYFRDSYDRAMAQLPTVISGININRIEVWVTNKNGDYNNPRNIVAFADLAEQSHISNNRWTSTGTAAIPVNNANNLYSEINSTYAGIRNIDQVNNLLNGNDNLYGGRDYEKLSSARLLSSSEYTINRALGFISLKTALRADEVLAVAYEYTYGGQTYQVGEFSTDVKDSKSTLFLKLIKPNSNSPVNACWDLMMKNVYSLGTRNIKSNDFKLDIYYASDSLGTNITYLPEEALKSKTLLQLLNLDRLDSNNTKEAPNGIFDFIEGYTVDAASGRIFFPSIEPFGNYLKEKIGNNALADKYIFQELYDSTRTVAKQIAEKDKFYIIGEYTGSAANVINTGSTNIPRGSVVVTAGGVTLTENSDYQVDYASGIVTILNQSIIDAGTNVQVSLESNTLFNMQRKTVLGLNWKYDFSNELNFGGTFMSLTEKPLTSKVDMGSEPLNNRIWGFNLSWKKQSQWLTNLLDRLPLISCTAPSSINLTAEFAKLDAGTSSDVQSEASYIDDFESTENGIDIKQASSWMLSSLPTGLSYSELTNNILTGYDRALISWYTIDPLFTRRSSSLTPAHIKSDLEQLSNHYVREVYERELYPNKESTYGESSTLSLFNVTFYPNERGPYNLDPDLDVNGKLNNPEKRWGGITRQLTTTDFEGANIQYIEFWLLDPFIYEQAEMGGDLYFNLGEVSEDILKDGKKFFENGLPASSNSYDYEETVWGRVPTINSLVYAFDNNADSRSQQDVGLDGLSNTDESMYPTYQNYLNAIKGRVRAEIYDSIAADPAGDNYHYFRGSDYDAAKKSIMERYKYYNNTEGNSPTSGGGESYSSAAKSTPDVEDSNQDFTMDEYENFFQYHISLRPENMQVGSNYITDKRTVTSKLRNGNTESVDWYKFRIPVEEYEKAVGNIRDFTSIRFLRMYMTSFRKPITLRFATMELIRGDWRPYQQPIASKNNTAPTISGEFTMSAINIEEHGDRQPVNYVLPPGISRIIDPSQPQLRQDNEQALALQVNNLGSKESRAVYKKSNLDVRQYERIQLYVHAEAPEIDVTQLDNNDLSLFVRLGSDYKSNYYEYEVPLYITPHGSYDSNSSAAAAIVWPAENMIDIPLAKLTNIKVKRNTLRNSQTGGINNTTIYSEYDEENPKNRISIVGSPTLGQVKVMMIGVRNNTSTAKSGTVWVNEMRLLGFNNKSGWAAQGNLNVKLSDLGTITAQGRMETAGFGGLEDKLASRRTDDYYRYTITGTFDLGRFLPKATKVSLPTYYSFTEEVSSPLYSPFDTDLLLDDVLNSYNGASRDSLKNIAEVHSVVKNFSISNAKINISSPTPMPYDPANLSFSLSYSTTENSGSTINWENKLNWKASINYNYSSPIKTIKPFASIKSKSKWTRILKDWGINPLPQSIGANTDMIRNYHEMQRRDLNAIDGGENIPLTFSQQFYWNRNFTMKWDPTTNLKMNISTGTNAEIEEPFLPVNKERFPNEYAIWKDSVKRSIKDFGRPLSYQQSFTASYNLPINKLPIFEWISSADINYTASYNWARGNKVNNINLGNNISNKRNVTLKGNFNMEKLYNIFPYLEETNKRFASSKSTKKAKNSKQKTKTVKAKKVKPFTKEITLSPDTGTVVAHNLNSKKFELNARTKGGKAYKVKYKVIDENSIFIKTKDTIPVKLTIIPKTKEEGDRSKLAKAMQYPTRALMMLRTFSINYTNAYAMTLPGFMPDAGDIFGQNSTNGFMAPGLDFAFGLTSDSWLRKAHERNWLLKNDSVAAQATTTLGEDLQVRATLEPLADLKIDLNASWTRNKNRTIQFMYDGMPFSESGSFSMTTISIGTAFDLGNADNNYKSSAYNKFIENIETIHGRVESKYANSKYPTGSTLAGQPYNPANGAVDKYSSDVLIPAFLSAYTGGDAGSSSLDIFPKFMRMLPNWKIKYSGLGKLPFFAKYFKSVNIEHGYKSVYAVGSYSTYATYMEYTNGIGFVSNSTTNLPVPSSRFNIGAVSINESFSPLIGLNVTTDKNLTIGAKYIKSRVLNLSLTAIQLVETHTEELALNVGYKIVNFKPFNGGKKASKSKEQKGNDINLRADFSFKNNTSLCRSIDLGTTQATSGNKLFSYSFTADYAYSKNLTLSLYFDRQKTIPLISASSYPTTTTDFGISMKFSLAK